MSFSMVLPQTGWKLVMTVLLRKEIYLVYLFKKKNVQYLKKKTNKTKTRALLLFLDTKTCCREFSLRANDNLDYCELRHLKCFVFSVGSNYSMFVFFKDLSGWLMCNMFCMQVVLK